MLPKCQSGQPTVKCKNQQQHIKLFIKLYWCTGAWLRCYFCWEVFLHHEGVLSHLTGVPYGVTYNITMQVTLTWLLSGHCIHTRCLRTEGMTGDKNSLPGRDLSLCLPRWGIMPYLCTWHKPLLGVCVCRMPGWTAFLMFPMTILWGGREGCGLYIHLYIRKLGLEVMWFPHVSPEPCHF